MSKLEKQQLKAAKAQTKAAKAQAKVDSTRAKVNKQDNIQNFFMAVAVVGMVALAITAAIVGGSQEE